MRQFIMGLVAVAGLMFLTGQVQAGKVEVKGVHICCPACVKAAGQILEKVDGVSDAACDRAAKTVTFAATDAKAASAGVQALLKGGFYGTATVDGKPLKIDVPTPKATKADKVVVNDVHVCCGACKRAITALFKDAKVDYDGTKTQKAVIVEGKDLDAAKVLETLRQAGFNGTVGK